jgi:RNA 2',3'-cyclic 3'-phosphodiesterase
MRTFIALEIPVEQSFMQVLKTTKEELALEKIKWVNFSTLHLTLFFLGETSNKTLELVNALLSEKLLYFPTFEIEVRSLGSFGKRHNPKVLWVGIKPNEHLTNLQNIVCECVLPYGFQKDERGFNPHITIGRIKNIEDAKVIEDIIDKQKGITLQKAKIDKLVIYESELTPKGPIYKPLFIHNLSLLSD